MNVMGLSQKRSTQEVHIPLFSQAMTTIQADGEGSIFIAPKILTRKCVKCSAALGIQNIKLNTPFQVNAGNFIKEK